MSVKYGQFDIPTFVHPFLEKVSGKLPAIWSAPIRYWISEPAQERKWSFISHFWHTFRNPLHNNQGHSKKPKADQNCHKNSSLNWDWKVPIAIWSVSEFFNLCRSNKGDEFFRAIRSSEDRVIGSSGRC
jgi:hypothetical protein